jgi:hypothetical protein
MTKDTVRRLNNAEATAYRIGRCVIILTNKFVLTSDKRLQHRIARELFDEKSTVLLIDRKCKCSCHMNCFFIDACVIGGLNNIIT